jgi:hypothetical protein
MHALTQIIKFNNYFKCDDTDDDDDDDNDNNNNNADLTQILSQR